MKSWIPENLNGVSIDPEYGSVMPPIYQTSTYAQTTPGGYKGFEYSRSANPTRSALEAAFASIENGEFGLAFGSGLAAIDAVMKLLKPADEVISTNDLYGGTYRLFTKIFEGFGIKFHFVGMENAEKIEEYINSKTKLIWVETPTNPMMNIIDIKKAALIVKDKALAEKLYFIQNASGAVCGPQDSFLALRGLKTLHIRMQRHCENGKAVAEYLAKHPKIENVYWPGFENHPNHSIAKEQMKDYGGMISFVTKGNNYDEAIKIVEMLKIFTLAESLGGVERSCRTSS